MIYITFIFSIILNIDLVVGAPYEDGGQGAVYVFQGSNNGLITKYSQVSKNVF